MQNKNSLRVLEEEPARISGITRRDAARRLLAGIAAGAALPWGTTSHPIWKHFEDDHLMNRAEASTTGGKLFFLNSQQFESLSSLAEAIVPGASEARVANFIDLLLSVDDEKHKKEFTDSLAAMETASDKRLGKPFSLISAAEKSEFLAFASTARKEEQAGAALRDAFENLKEWISGAYYSSEAGMRELGWTPDRVFAEFPGCSHTEGHG